MSDGWNNLEKQRDGNGNQTAVAKAIQAIIANGCDCDGVCFAGICEAAIHEQFDEITRLRTELADIRNVVDPDGIRTDVTAAWLVERSSICACA